MASKVFISWGGDLSKKLAEEINNWLPSVLQFVKPYFSPDDIEKGSRWESSIVNELDSSNVGIICLTKDNINRPWILFEAGALSKNFGKSNVCTILFNVDSADFSGPLTSFQATKFEKSDFKKLLQTINNTGGESKLSPTVLTEVFEMWWPRLEEKISNILSSNKIESKTDQRTERDILEEILELSRMSSKRDSRKRSPRHIIRRLIDLLIEMQHRSLMKDEKGIHFIDPVIENELPAIVEQLCYELDCLDVFERYKIQKNQLFFK